MLMYNYFGGESECSFPLSSPPNTINEILILREPLIIYTRALRSVQENKRIALRLGQYKLKKKKEKTKKTTTTVTS